MNEARVNAAAAGAPTSHELTLFRLYLMRGLFLLICLGEGSIIWPLMFKHPEWRLMHAVACSLLAALSMLCAFGVRYPVQMLPLLLFEFAWKTIFVVMIALPLWHSHQMTPEYMESTMECLLGVVLCPLVIPWKYVWRNYVRRTGDRWSRTAPVPAT